MSKRLGEVTITSDLKSAVEREVVELFSRPREVRETKNKPQVQQSQSKPHLPEHHEVVDHMSELDVHEVPHEHSKAKDKDIYSIITKMNASLELEEETRKKVHNKTRQQIYREELDKQLKEKETGKN